MTDSSMAAIGELVSPIATWTPERDCPDGQFTYIDLSAVDQEAKIVTGARSLLCAEAPSRARQLLASGDVLVSTVRPNLNGVARVPPELQGATASTGFCVLRPRPERLDGRYLFHWVRSPRFVANMVQQATGASYPAISDRIVYESTLPAPPLPEQRRIAEVLDRADALRSNRQAALAQLATLAQSIFFDTFGDPETNPMRWPKMCLGELILDGPQNGLYKPATEYGSGTPIVRIDAFYDGVVTNLASLKRVRVSEKERALYGLAPGEILVNRVNSREYLGKSAIVPELPEPTVFESNMMRFAVDPNLVDPVFLIEYLQTAFVRAHVLQRAKDAVNQSSINQDDVKSIPVVVPATRAQEVFRRRLGVVDVLNAASRTSLTQLDSLFASLQQRAFAGEL